MAVTKADLHIHTRVSDGMASVEKVLEFVEHKTDLTVIAVTDHEDATGGLRARELAAKRGYRIEVVVGAEITTLGGHLIALYIESAPRSFRRVESTLEAIHAHGGLAVVPHPMSWLTRSLSRRTIDRICRKREAGIMFDAVETGNPSPAGRITAQKAAMLNEHLWHLPPTGGSDAHHLLHIGTGWTEFDGAGAEDLRVALQTGATTPMVTRYPSIRAVGIRQTAAGLVWGYAATPRKMLRIGTRRDE